MPTSSIAGACPSTALTLCLLLDLVAQKCHAVVEPRGLDRLQVVRTVEEVRPRAAGRRADQHPELVDEAGVQQGAHEFQAPPQPDVLAAPLLELPDGGGRVAR